MQAPRPADGQALEIELGHAAQHEIGDDARGAASHRPAHVAVAAVEEEVAVPAEAESARRDPSVTPVVRR
jgi:hypothetical protein